MSWRGRLASLAACFGLAASAAAAEPPACQAVRMADIGWADVTSTTALTGEILTRLGYRPKVSVLSVPVTYMSMKNKDIDVFLGNWMPSMSADSLPFIKDGSVAVIRTNLTGAKYTLAVPDYLYAQGLKSFADIQTFAPQLKNTIYGIEPGNDGNRLVIGMIKADKYGLRKFNLIESSEQGMLAEVDRAVHSQRPIVFLGWAPHPMNMRFHMRYLSGGDEVFGPNFGGAVVKTNTRAGYIAECPNVGRLLKNLSFNVEDEAQMMSLILDQKQPPAEAANAWIERHPKVVAAWLDGVTTLDGRPALAAVLHGSAAVGAGGLEGWIAGHKIPVGAAVERSTEFAKNHSRWFFNGVSAVVSATADSLTALLMLIPPLIFTALAAGLAWWRRRSLTLSVFVAAAGLYIVNQGYWLATMETLSLVLMATSVSALIGVPLGIAAAHRPWLYAGLRPVLDLMQTLPSFVYLIPTLVLFGLGVAPGLISTVIFALPAPIRLTYLGVVSTPRPLIEAGQAFGATPQQLLWKVELPSAFPMIMTGLTQCIMLSLSMVVIAALVGAGGLGVPVVRALNTVQIGMGFEAGFAIVLLAIVLDRITHSASQNGGRS